MRPPRTAVLAGVVTLGACMVGEEKADDTGDSGSVGTSVLDTDDDYYTPPGTAVGDSYGVPPGDTASPIPTGDTDTAADTDTGSGTDTADTADTAVDTGTPPGTSPGTGTYPSPTPRRASLPLGPLAPPSGPLTE